MNKEKFLKHHPSVNYVEELKQICRPLKLLNIDYFSHAQIDNKNRFSALGTEPEFSKIYIEKDYHRFDIHMANIEQKESYIIWDNINLERESRELSNDLMSFNLGHSFTLIQKQKNYTDYFHFSTKLGQYYMNQQYLLNLDRLYQFIYHFRDKVNAHSGLKQAYNFKLSIPENGAFFASNETFSVSSECDKEKLITKRIYIDQSTFLTAREFECLGYLAQGKKLIEVAKLMRITNRTAKAHIQNIKSKLNCKNQFQLGVIYSSIRL